MRTKAVRACLNWCAHRFGALLGNVVCFFETQSGGLAFEIKGRPVRPGVAHILLKDT